MPTLSPDMQQLHHEALQRMPEEIILEAFVQETPRFRLLEELKQFSYTYGEYAPDPYETRGTWDQVVAAFLQELLTEKEFEEVRAAIGR